MSERNPGRPARLIQMVSRFRPDTDGVGECALMLGDALWKAYGIRTDFLICNAPRPGSVLELPESFPHALHHVARGGSEPVGEALDKLMAASGGPTVLLVHFVAYGYSREGTPMWVPRVMERFIRKGGRLLVFFHELYATASFPSRVFFTSWLQRRIFRRLLSQCEAGFTSSEEYVEQMQLDNWKHRPINLIGVCSNVGEPESPRPLAKRTRRISVFGLFATRKRVYIRYLEQLRRVAEHLGVEEIADIGPVDDPAWMAQVVEGVKGIKVRSYGTLSQAETSRLLGDSILGAVPYRYAVRWKSGVVAAYQAHATAVLLFPYADEIELREPGSWSLSTEQLLAMPAKELCKLQEAATSGYQDYQRYRSTSRMAETIFSALAELPPQAAG